MLKPVVVFLGEVDEAGHLAVVVGELRVPIEAAPHPTNLEYLRTKRDKLGHLLKGI